MYFRLSVQQQLDGEKNGIAILKFQVLRSVVPALLEYIEVTHFCIRSRFLKCTGVGLGKKETLVLLFPSQRTETLVRCT